MKFRTLKPNEIDVKVGNVTAKGYTLLLYKNARVDMAILDETVGEENWQRDHKEVKGNLYCGIGINCGVIAHENDGRPYVKDRWVWKWDCGVESAFGDKEKGESSDSFKRASSCWGIGRELYTSPFIFIPCKTEKQDNGGYKIADADEKYRKFYVKEIYYNDNREITGLVIIDNNDFVAFDNVSKKKDIPKNDLIIGGKYIFASGKHKGKSIEQVAQEDAEYLDWLLDSDKVGKAIKDNIVKFRSEG